jgi:hypothetical protein
MTAALSGRMSCAGSARTTLTSTHPTSSESACWAFYQVPDWLYFRRDHPGMSLRAHPTMRTNCTNLDPRRADRLRHPAPRLVAEYIWAYVSMIRRAPLSHADRRDCYRYLAEWAASRAVPRSIRGEGATTAARSRHVG